MRILIAMMKHETNTFSPVPHRSRALPRLGPARGPDVVRAYRGTNHPIAAFIDLAEAAGAEIVTPVAAEAMPSGLVRREAYDYLTGRILDAWAQGGFDAAIARPARRHGGRAGVGRRGRVPGAHARHRARRCPSPSPSTCTATSRSAWRDNCTVFNGYKSYPHTDMYATGRRSAAHPARHAGRARSPGDGLGHASRCWRRPCAWARPTSR